MFRLVYLVLAFVLDCSYKLFLQLPGVVSILDLGPYTSLPRICSLVLSSEGSIVSTLDGKLPPTRRRVIYTCDEGTKGTKKILILTEAFDDDHEGRRSCLKIQILAKPTQD